MDTEPCAAAIASQPPPAPVPEHEGGDRPSIAAEYRQLLRSLKDDRHDAVRHIDVARFLIRKKRYSRAMAPLRVARALQPRRPETYRLLAFVYRMLGNLPQAVVALRQLLKIEDSAQARFQLADILLLQDKHDRAEIQFGRAVEQDHRLRAAYRKLAWLAECRGDLKRSMNFLEHIVELEKDNPDILFSLGRVHAKAGRPDQAISAFRRSLELNPEHIEARRAYIELALDEGAPEVAIQLIKEGYGLHSHHLELLLLEGRAQEASGARDRALAAYITASRRCRSDHRPFLALGKLYSLQDDFDLAENALLEALKRKPRESEIYRTLGALYVKSGSPSRAESVFLDMIEVFPESVEAWRLLGQVREHFHKIGEAVAAYTKAIDLAPADAGLFCARAQVLIKNADYDKAIADFQRARELDPDCEEAGFETDLIRKHQNYREAFTFHERAQEALAQGDLLSAKGHYDRVLALVPNNLRWLDEYSRICIRLGTYKEAVGALERILSVEKNNGAVLLRLGDLLYGLNRYDEAWRLFERCIDDEPHNVPVRIRLIRSLGHRVPAGTLSPDKFPRLEKAYSAGLNEPSRASLAHLELGYLFLCFGSHIFPLDEWQDKALFHLGQVRDRPREETTRYRLLGEFEVFRRQGRHDNAIGVLLRLCELFPSSTTYAVALLEYLKDLGRYARAFRLSEQFCRRFPGHGLLRSLNLEFFSHLASQRDNAAGLRRKRIIELQRDVAARNTDADTFLSLGLGLIALSPPGERFESGRKIVVAFNRAAALAPESPWPTWGFLKEALRNPGGKTRATADRLASICNKGLKQFPDFSPFPEQLGRSLISSPDPVEKDRGRSLLERAALIDREATGALFALGCHYDKQDDHVTAMHYYLKTQEGTRGTFYSRKALERLSRMVC